MPHEWKEADPSAPEMGGPVLRGETVEICERGLVAAAEIVLERSGPD